MKRLALGLFVAVCLALPAIPQSIAFGFGDPILEASLNDIGASAKVDLPGFTAEVSLQWGLSASQVQSALSQGLQPSEVYLAAALAKLSGKPLSVVINMYKVNKAKGWGFVARELGIKPGSTEFRALKGKTSDSDQKLKKNKKH